MLRFTCRTANRDDCDIYSISPNQKYPTLCKIQTYNTHISHIVTYWQMAKH